LMYARIMSYDDPKRSKTDQETLAGNPDDNDDQNCPTWSDAAETLASRSDAPLDSSSVTSTPASFASNSLQFPSKKRARMVRRLYFHGCEWVLGSLAVALLGLILILYIKTTQQARNKNSITLTISIPANFMSLTRDDQIILLLERALGSSTLQDPIYAQALQWIISYDPAQLNPLNSSNVVQRFLAAYFYYSTTVESAAAAGSGSEAPPPWSACGPPPDPWKDSSLCTYRIEQYDEPITSHRWLTNASECQWAGLFCDYNGQVRQVEWNSQHLTGTFPSGISYWPFLHYVQFWSNNLTGPLPGLFFAETPHLVEIHLTHNQLTGTIPIELFQNIKIKVIGLNSNPFEGSLRSEVGNLLDLKGLYLDSADITGTLPSELANCASLSVISLDNNRIQGSIPDAFIRWNTITGIWLHDNLLSGSIPSYVNLFNRTLIALDLSENRFTGSLPDELSTLTNLQMLDLHLNNLTGTIDPSFSKFGNQLIVLSLAQNPLHGTIPTELAKVSAIYQLDLFGTDLTGAVPSQICSLRGGANGLTILTADCKTDANGTAQIICSCCTICCQADGSNCSPSK